ncbi:MAG TPA: hypothetical protein VEH53_00455 [archaeon]|nr:hypothetical protein [archaeon]
MPANQWKTWQSITAVGGQTLRKRSAASSGSRELRSSITYFIDRSLGERFLAEALRTHGLTVHIHRDHFAPDAKDQDWLREVGQRR